MESIRIPFKKDIYGNPIYARLSWSKEEAQTPKPIVLIYHMGGFLIGSSEVIPKTQIDYLCSKGFMVVIPNFRLAPQVTGKEAMGDCEESYDWATATLPSIMSKEHGITLDTKRVVAMGHSAGGTAAMHIGAVKSVKAVTAFSVALYPGNVAGADMDFPPFNQFPEFTPTEEDWKEITPPNLQISEAGLAAPGTKPSPRSLWQMSLIKQGKLLSTVVPDEDYSVLDPMTRVSSNWPPVMIVQGDADMIPGSRVSEVRRAEKEMKEAGVKEVEVIFVPGEGHCWDLPPTVGTSDLGPRWQTVVKGLDWLVSHV